MPERPVVGVSFLDELTASDRSGVERILRSLRLGQDQTAFCVPPATVLEACERDVARDPFAIMVRTGDGDQPVGIGVLHPLPGDHDAWDQRCLKLRGLVVDHRWQGRGIGGQAVGLAIAAARSRYSDHSIMRLDVHTDNEAARALYAGCGFAPTGHHVAGRQGHHEVMTLPLSPA